MSPPGPLAGFDPARYFAGRRVLITGGLGFIGSNLTRRLLELDAQVTVVDALIANYGGNRANLADVSKSVDVHIADLNDLEAIAPLIEGRQTVFNVAGQVSHLDSMTEPLVDLQANVRAQIVLLEACRRLAPEARIIYASTRQIYGRPRYLPVDERHPMDPVDINGVHKMAGEAYHTLFQHVYGLQTVSLRLTNTYGPRMRVKDARQTFLGVWLRRVTEGATFEVWGGEQKRDLSYVDDAIDAFLLAAAPGVPSGSVFNIGGSPPLTLLDLARRLVRCAGRGRFEVRPFPAERAKIDIGDYYADDSRFRAVTGWRPRVSLEEGLERSIEFYRRNLGAYV